MDQDKLQRHIDHLVLQHHEIDKRLTEEVQHRGDLMFINELKKKKLNIKDEIERLKKA